MSDQLLTSTDERGNTHNRYSQYYKGLKVIDADYTIHSKGDLIEAIHGHFFNVGAPIVVPKISEEAALERAQKFINAKRYKWESEQDEKWLKATRNDSLATYFPKGQLVVILDTRFTKKYRAAYQFIIESIAPYKQLEIYIDALSGVVIASQNLLMDANADTKYSGSQTISTQTNSSGQYILRETRNGVNIATLNCQGYSSPSYGIDYTDADNNWSATEYHNTNQDDAALDIHWATELVLDYWNSVRSRNSWNNSGAAITSYYNFNMVPLVGTNDNAFWDPTNHIFAFGNGSSHCNAVASFDVVAHEIGHAFAQGVNPTNRILHTSYPSEALALNEGASDIWAAIIENNKTSGKQTWEIGEDIMKNSYPSMRSLQDPLSGGDPTFSSNGFGYPAIYQGTNWDTNMEPHNNGTVLGHWFYILCNGGSGTGISSPLSISSAASIFWQAELTSFGPSTNYSDARLYTIYAAESIYGSCSNEVIAVTNAWHSVGIGAAYTPPYSDITVSQLDCNTVRFTSSIVGSSYAWNVSGDLASGITSPITTTVNYVDVSTVTGGNINLHLQLDAICGTVDGYSESYPYQQNLNFTTPMPVIGYYSNFSASVNPVYGAYNYKWYINSTLVAQGYDLTNFSSAYYNGPYCGENNAISVIAETDCGSYTIATDYFDWDCSTGYGVSHNKTIGTELISLKPDVLNNSKFAKIYPNPAKDYLTILLPEDKQGGIIKLINSNGDVVLISKGNGLINLYISNLSNGLYIIEIVQNGIVTREKVLIQH